CGDTFATNQKFKYHLTERKHPCVPQNILQATVPVSSSESLSNLDSQFQVVKNPNARKLGESVKQWGSRLRKKVKELDDKDRGQPKNLAETKALYDELLQLDPNVYFRPVTKEEKHKVQGFFDEPEIEEANLQRPHTQAHHKGRLTKSEKIVTQQTTPLDNIELQPVQELPMHEEGFLDLDVEVPWPVRFPYNEEHQAKEIDLASIILGAENEDEAMQK
ncbi:25369_t:CDS:2, partial [Racocetra persica]